MWKKSRNISFQHEHDFKSTAVFARNYPLNHIINEHIEQNTEVWIRFTDLNKALVNRFNSNSCSLKPVYHLLYSNLAEVLFTSIQWSADFPLYIKLTEVVSSTMKHSKQRIVKIYLFLAQSGFIVFTRVRPARLTIETAFFPERVGMTDSRYLVFSRSFAHIRRRYYQDKVIIDKKYDQTRRITECIYVNRENWQDLPSIEKYSELMNNVRKP